MKFNLFKQLYTEALEEAGLENYIERGWQDWMDDYSPNMVADLLTRIHTLANNPLKDTRDVSRAEFARTYDVPIRTLESWDADERQAPRYVKMLIDFAQFNQ